MLFQRGRGIGRCHRLVAESRPVECRAGRTALKMPAQRRAGRGGKTPDAMEIQRTVWRVGGFVAGGQDSNLRISNRAALLTNVSGARSTPRSR